MKKMRIPLTVSAMLCAAVSLGASESLFNGEDLSGWTAVLDNDVTGGCAAREKTWDVVDGAIRSTGTPFGYLRTKRADFADFRLRVEYRWWRKTEAPNSGVFVRLSGERGSFIPTCYENQLCEGKAGDLLGLAGAPIEGREPRDAYDPSKPLSGITACPKARPSSERPFGEWNVLEVAVRGSELVSCVNGVEQNRVRGLVLKKGAIALQSEGGAIEFRKIVVEEF